MLKKFSLLAFALAIAVAGCATPKDQPSSKADTIHVSVDRSVAQDDCRAYVDNVSGGHMTIVGKDCTGSQSRYQVNIYINGDYENQVMTNENGSFSYTTKEFPAGTHVKIQINDFNGSGRHLTRSFTVPKNGGGDAPEPRRPGECQITQSVSGETMTIVGHDCTGPNDRYQVNFYFNGNFERSVYTNSNGSFSHSVNVPPGTNVKVQVNDFRGAGDHQVASFTMPKPKVPDHRVREYANQQARTVANRVVAWYGALENWKYNFTMGFWIGTNEYNRSGAAETQREIGHSEGARRGDPDGRAAGKSHGYSSGRDNGGGVAIERYRAIVNTGKAPDTSVGTVSIPNFTGLGAPENACNTVAGYGTSLEGELAREMQQLRFSDDGVYLAYDAGLYSITFNEIYAWGPDKYEFVDTWFRAEWAWAEWKTDRRLGGRYDYNLYNDLDYDQQNDFEGYFKSVYNAVIDEKFHREKTRYNAMAQARGEHYGALLAKRKAYDSGCNEGYGRAYSASSIPGFRETYEGGYRAGFGATVNHYNSNPVVTIDGLRLLDGNMNGVFELGEALGIEVGSYTNLGRVAANGLRVTVSGPSVTSLPSDETVSLAPSTSKAINQRVMNLAKIKMDIVADQSQSIVASVGSKSQEFSYTVSWKGTIEALTTLDPRQARGLKGFVIQNIKSEMLAAVSAKSKKFYKTGSASKLNDLVALHARTPAGNRAILAEVGTELLAWAKAEDGASLKGNKWKLGSLKEDFRKMCKAIGGAEAKKK